LKKIQLPKTAARAGAQLTGATSNWIGSGNKADDVFASKPEEDDKSDENYPELDSEGLSMPEPKVKPKQKTKQSDAYDLPDL
jgi:hypothetical protein